MNRTLTHKVAILAISVLSYISAPAKSACITCLDTPSSQSQSPQSQTNSSPSFWQSPTLTGEWGGVRKQLEDSGVTLRAGYIVDVLGNPVGGVSQGAVYSGLLGIGANIDFQKLIGWEGGSFGTQWYWISGQDLTDRRIHNMFAVDSIAGFQTFRLNSLWIQQNLFSDKVSLRAGVLSLSSEFDSSPVSSLFLNDAFCWSPFLCCNIPNGGPACLMGAPGVRLALKPTDWFTYQAAITQGNVYPQNVNRHGFRWRLSSDNGLFFIQEAIFHLNPSGRYWGNYRLGSWIFSGDIASCCGTEHTNLYGFYAMGDQMLFPTSIDNKNQGLAAFGHIAFGPSRNMISFYVDGGLNYTGLFSCRPNDSLGIAIAYGKMGDTGCDMMMGNSGNMMMGDMSMSMGTSECVLEATYRFQVTGWMSLQPDIQYVMQPGGNIPNALVVGLRTAITF